MANGTARQLSVRTQQVVVVAELQENEGENVDRERNAFNPSANVREKVW